LPKSFTGHCPIFNDEREITVYYTPFPVLGSNSPVYKASKYDCDDAEDCPIGSCPIFIAASKK